MKKVCILCLLILASCQNQKQKSSKDFTTVFESSDGLKTATYEQVIAYYKDLATDFPEISIDSLGLTDSGKPLHYVTYNPEGSTKDFTTLKQSHSILLINNGIHPGESDGIDATMMLFRDLAQGKIEQQEHVVLVTIPVYNVGGSLNRNSGTRTNQNGPESYGFRGNAQNYDLNRDFVKADTRNAQNFARIFHKIKPDVFIDNHVSNGADYQYTLTHLFTQHNKLSGPQGHYLDEVLMPDLERDLLDKGWDITPYVNVFNRVPETGFTQFIDHPRYSTGYTTLFNCLGMMVETHMLKPYKQRVEGTYELMMSMISHMNTNPDDIKTLANEQISFWNNQDYYPTKWVVDTNQKSTLNFKGYEGEFIESAITGSKRLKYNRNAPFTKPVDYLNSYKAVDSVKIPEAYIIPKGWRHVLSRLDENQIEYQKFEKDTIISVEVYRISDYKTRGRAYEGHYSHSNTVVTTELKEMHIHKGDLLVKTKQFGMRYILETLEPSCIDSFFNWNYFDTILQQKEGFSPYVWEDKALMLLKQNPQLQIDFNMKKTFDSEFAENWYAQLDWIHKQSNHYEQAHMTYPIFRIPK